MSDYKRNFIGALAAAAVTPWVLFSPRMAQWLYQSQLFHPEEGKGSMEALKAFRDVENHPVLFRTHDGDAVCGWLFRQSKSRKIILLSHGNAGDIARRLDLIKLLLRSGATVFAYDYRGFGLTAGKATLRGICEDGLAAYDFVRDELGYRPEDIVLYGESLGTGVTGFISERRQCAGLILQSGFKSLVAIAKEKVKATRAYPTFMFPQPRLDNLAVVKRKHPPLLLIHGEKDTTIPFSHSVEMFAAASEPKQFVPLPECGHTDLSDIDPDFYAKSVSDFIASLS